MFTSAACYYYSVYVVFHLSLVFSLLGCTDVSGLVDLCIHVQHYLLFSEKKDTFCFYLLILYNFFLLETKLTSRISVTLTIL